MLSILSKENGIKPGTIHILREANQVTDQPQKRPKSSLIRFEAAQPNKMWQSDFTHWRLADGTDTEILDYIDDYSRFLISIHAYRRVTGKLVVKQFTQACEEHGRPQSSLTDNGLVFTTRFTTKDTGDPAAKNQFEKLLQDWDIKQINGSPNHPQTQGKIERFHRTLKLWLTTQPRAKTLAMLNELGPQVRVQRCLVHVQRNVKKVFDAEPENNGWQGITPDQPEVDQGENP